MMQKTGEKTIWMMEDEAEAETDKDRRQYKVESVSSQQFVSASEHRE